jgi:hypothetical protein
VWQSNLANQNTVFFYVVFCLDFTKILFYFSDFHCISQIRFVRKSRKSNQSLLYLWTFLLAFYLNMILKASLTTKQTDLNSFYKPVKKPHKLLKSWQSITKTIDFVTLCIINYCLICSGVILHTFFSEFWIDFDNDAAEGFEQLNLEQVLVLENRIAQERLQLCVDTFKNLAVRAILNDAGQRRNGRAPHKSLKIKKYY